MPNVFRLPNGVTLVHDDRPGSGKVDMQIAVRGGSAYEEASENGLTYLTQQAMLGGTTTRSREQIAHEIEAPGGAYQAGAGETSVFYFASTFTDKAEDAFSVLADVVRHPAFDMAEIEQARMEVQQAIALEAGHPDEETDDKFNEALFGPQSASGRPIKGTQQLVASFTPQQIKDKHKEILSDPGDIVISIAGDMDFTTASRLANDNFADLVAQGNKVVPKTKFFGGDLREEREIKQLNIQFGFPAPGYNDDKRYAFQLLQELLSGGMSAPLFQEIREKRGLVYRVGAAYAPSNEDGTFYVDASTGGNAQALMSATFELLGNVAKNGFTDEEIDTARERLLRKLAASGERSANACSRNAAMMLAYGRIVSNEETEKNLRTVTANDIRGACVSMLKDGKYALACIGPQKTMPPSDDIKAMMKEQVDGIVIPPSSVPASLKANFARAATTGFVPSPAPQMTTLSNGMRVVTIEREGTLSCGMWVGTGSAHESPQRSGIKHMIEHMMFRGTKSYGPGVIDKLVEGELRGGLNAYTSFDKTAYYFYNLAPDGLEKGIDIIGEMVFETAFDETEFSGLKNPDGSIDELHKGERNAVLEEIKQYADDPDDILWQAFSSAAYPGQSQGRPILGTADVLTALTTEDLKDDANHFYVPNNVVLCVTGPAKHAGVVALAERKFGQRAPVPVLPLPRPTFKGGVAVREHADVNQCSFFLGIEGPPADDPDTYAWGAFVKILSSGESSRLTHEIVNRQKLTGAVGAWRLELRNASITVIQGAVTADNMKPLIGEIYKEVNRAARDITEDELAKVKNIMKMQVLSTMEANQTACNVYGQGVLTFGKPLTAQEVAEKIDSITLDDVRRVAEKASLSDPTLSMVVPKGTDPALLPTHEEVVAQRDRKTPDSGPKPSPGGPPAP